MEEQIRTIALGAATVSVINIGDILGRLDQWIQVPEAERPPHYAKDFAQPLRLPIQCMHIATPGASVLVDAPRYTIESDSPYFLPDYQPPPALLACLTASGIEPASLTRVVITHAHFDHYNATTLEQDGRLVPTFPGVRHCLGRADWERPENMEALSDPHSLVSCTLAVVQQHGQLELVEGDIDLGHGIGIVAAPGESPGHQIVRIHSEGRTLYCLGDLIHHPLELERPDWMVPWADTAATLASRESLLEAVLAEDALLVATHIRPIGKMERTDSGLRWRDVG